MERDLNRPSKFRKWVAGVAAAGMLFTSVPVSAQTNDDDDHLSGGALAVLLLAVGGAVAGVLYREDDLNGRIKGALQGQHIAYSDAQLRSLTQQAAGRLRSRGPVPGEFTVCAAPEGRAKPCLKVVLRDLSKPARPGALTPEPQSKPL